MILLKLANLNPKIDKVIFLAYVLILGGLVLHFIGNILSGRFRERFIHKKMKKITPEEYLFPAVRVTHWVHLICIFGLIFTGFCLRYKVWEAHRIIWRRHHYYL